MQPLRRYIRRCNKLHRLSNKLHSYVTIVIQDQNHMYSIQTLSCISQAHGYE